MTTQIAVVTSTFGDSWDEQAVLAGRVAGALACVADVDVLTPRAPCGSRSDPTGVETAWDGACRVLRFPAAPGDPRLRAAWKRVVFGDAAERSGPCRCVSPPSRGLPTLIEEQLVLAEGFHSSELYDHLRVARYDAVVFVGLHSPATYFGVKAVADRARAIVAPGRWETAFDLAVHDATLTRADHILVCTEGERERMALRLGREGRERIVNTGFLLGVNPVVMPEGAHRRGDHFVLAARDWRTVDSPGAAMRWVETMASGLPDNVELRLVGPGAARLPYGVPHTDARIDAWWWMSRALAVIDPEPDRLVGQEILESMLFRVPVVVAADGGATREHAELGNAGVWFQVAEELIAAVELLLDPELRFSLGQQGEAYATVHFSDRSRYVKTLAEAVLG